MKNIWIEKRRDEVLKEFKLLNFGVCGYIFEVDHPTAKQYHTGIIELVPLTTRIVICHVTGNVQVICGMTLEHSKHVKETAELFRSALISRAMKTIWIKNESNRKRN